MEYDIPKNALARNILWAASLCAVGLTLYAGRTNQHYFLTAIFVVWVLAPFAGVLVVSRLSAGWALKSKALIYWLGISISVATVAAYVYDLIYPRISQHAFMYTITPAISWLVIGVTSLVAFKTRKRNHSSFND